MRNSPARVEDAIFEMFKWALVLGVGLTNASPVAGSELRIEDVQQGIVLIKVDFVDGAASTFGTGFFVDHDGLIATAEHTLFGYESVEGNGQQRQGHKPSVISVRSSALDAEFRVDAEEGIAVLRCGRDLRFAWLDLCLIRVELTPEQRQAVQPLDVTTRKVRSGEEAWAFGPRCSDHSKEHCWTVLPQHISISTLSKKGETLKYLSSGSTLTNGYSGGPLVDTNGLVVGVCSKGDPVSPIPTVTYLNHIGEFTPVQYLEYFDGVFPASSFFKEPTDCESWRAWKQLTHFDCKQLTVIAKNPQRYCTCVCIALTTDPGALSPPIDSARDDFLRCASPGCLAQVAIASVRVLVESSRETTSELDDRKGLKAWGAFVGAAYEMLVENAERLNETEQATVFKSLGDLYYRASVDSELGKLVAGENMTGRAFEAYSKSLTIQPDQQDAWRSLSGLFVQNGDLVSAHRALREAQKYGLPQAPLARDSEYLKTLTETLSIEEREKIRVVLGEDERLRERIVLDEAQAMITRGAGGYEGR